VYAATLARETHVGKLASAARLKIQISFSYSDGFGRVKENQADQVHWLERTGCQPRWVSGGWTITNNKANQFDSITVLRRHAQVQVWQASGC
jgi:hypothetical protein